MELQQIMKGDFDTFMQKEIYEQPEAAVNSMRGRVNFEKVKKNMKITFFCIYVCIEKSDSWWSTKSYPRDQTMSSNHNDCLRDIVPRGVILSSAY